MSGDKDSTDKRINTFKPLTTKSPINDLLILGPANVIVFTPEAEVSPCRGLGIVFRYYAFWRFSTQDGIYNSDIKVVIRPGNSGYNQKERSMATGIVAELNYNPNKHLNITLLAGHFVPGEYVIHTGAGKNLDAMMLKFGYRF
jgi:hypothetical protein